MSRPFALDEVKQREICALLACGASRREAAEYVGCVPTTIANAARRDPDFAERLDRAEADYLLRNLRLINRSASRSWRAAAWNLEQMGAEDFHPTRRTPPALAAAIRELPDRLARGGNGRFQRQDDIDVGVPASAGQRVPSPGEGDPSVPDSNQNCYSAQPTDPPDGGGPLAPGITPGIALRMLEQAVIAAGLNEVQQDAVLIQFVFLTNPDLAERLGQCGPRLHDAAPASQS